MYIYIYICYKTLYTIEEPVPRGLPREPGATRCSNIIIDPHRACRHTSAVILGLCILLTCMMVVCLMIIYLIANLGPGVSGRNSLPLPGTPGPRSLGRIAFWAPLDFCIDFCIDFGVDFGPYFGPKFAYFQLFFEPIFKLPFVSDFGCVFCHLFVPQMS